MENVIEHLPLTPSIDQLARIIANVAAPAFLLGAVASFISVLMTRINRVVDRVQFINGIPGDDSRKLYLRDDLPRLKRRAILLDTSLRAAVLSAILTALIIVSAFVSAFLHFAHEYGIATLFILAMLTFCASLINLAREVKISLHDNDFHA